jgi:ATP-dependent Lon protease
MRGLLNRFIKKETEAGSVSNNVSTPNGSSEELKLEVDALYVVLSNLYGTDKLILKASKLEALSLMRSDNLNERVMGLQKLVHDDPTEKQMPEMEELPKLLQDIEEAIAEMVAKRSVEERLNQAVTDKMQERHEEYLKEIKNQIIRICRPENAQTLKKTCCSGTK